jgi:hypothetical protein
MFCTTTRVGRRIALQIGQSSTTPRPSGPNPIEEAERLNRAFRESGLLTLAAFANQIGVSRARVSQILALLRLPESVKEYVRRMGPMLPKSAVSERALRPIARLASPSEQCRSFRAFRALLRDKRLPIL